jgi:hypothetical protein
MRPRAGDADRDSTPVGSLLIPVVDRTAALVTAPAARRPLKFRGSLVVRRIAAALAVRRVAPNAISIAGAVVAGAGAAALLAAGQAAGAARAALLAGGAVAIQLRLLCSLLDGLVAVEGGLGGPDGELFNEAPDRISDSLLLVAAGYAASVPRRAVDPAGHMNRSPLHAFLPRGRLTALRERSPATTLRHSAFHVRRASRALDRTCLLRTTTGCPGGTGLTATRRSMS